MEDAALSVKAREESQFTVWGAGVRWGRGVQTFKVKGIGIGVDITYGMGYIYITQALRLS